MTMPDECVQAFTSFERCLKENGLLGNIIGKCEPFKQGYENCMRVVMERKRVQNLDDARERKKRWDDLRKETGMA